MTFTQWIRQSHWRYKVLWLSLSLLVYGTGVGLQHMGQSGVVVKAAYGVGLISVIVSAGVLVWYAVLAGVGTMVRSGFSHAPSKTRNVGEKVAVWMVSLGMIPFASSVLEAQLPFSSTQLQRLTLVTIVLGFFAVIRTLDISRKASPGVAGKPPLFAWLAADKAQDDWLDETPILGPAYDIIDGVTDEKIDGVPTSLLP